MPLALASSRSRIVRPISPCGFRKAVRAAFAPADTTDGTAVAVPINAPVSASPPCTLLDTAPSVALVANRARGPRSLVAAGATRRPAAPPATPPMTFWAIQSFATGLASSDSCFLVAVRACSYAALYSGESTGNGLLLGITDSPPVSVTQSHARRRAPFCATGGAAGAVVNPPAATSSSVRCAGSGLNPPAATSSSVTGPAPIGSDQPCESSSHQPEP